MLNKSTEAVKLASGLSKESLMEKLTGVKNYDDIDSPLSVRGADTIVAALKNEDRDGMLGILFEKNPEGVLAGAAAAAKVTGASQIKAVVRTQAQKSALEGAAAAADMELSEVIVDDFINVREYSDTAVFMHPSYLTALADCLEGKAPSVVLALKGEEPKEVLFGTPWVSVAGGGAKGYMIGGRIYSGELLDGQVLPNFIYGSGVIRKIEAESCIIQTAAGVLEALREDSCGKCTFCREGLFQLKCIFEDAQRGRASNSDLLLVRELADSMSFLNNCSLGKNAAMSALSVLDNFSDEVDEHVNKKVCRTGSCGAYTSYYIDSSKCTGSGKCSQICPEDAIEIKPGYTSIIDSFGCTHCGKCIDVCENGAILKTQPGKKAVQKAVRLQGAAQSVETSKKSDKPQVDPKEIARLKRKARMVKPAIKAVEPEKEEAAVKSERKNGPVKKMETDIVIIAGGPAGLAAAVAAGESGVKTILIDKANGIGGAANMGMGPLGIGTKIQKENFNDISVEYALKKHMEYTHYRVDEDLVSAYFHKSADTIEWLQSMGVEFFGAFRYFKESEATWHIVKADNGVIGPRAAGKMARILSEKAKEQGTEFLMETAGTDLIVEDGKVVGCYADASDGTQLEIRAKAVIVATGGFIGNKEMVKEEFGLTLREDFFPFHMPGLQGDGLKMMWKAGAQKFGLNIEAIYQVPDNSTWGVLDGVLRQPNLLINQFGERFMDEGDMGNTTYTGNAIHLQPGNYGYCIMDRGILRSYQKNGPDIVDLVHPGSVFFEFEETAKKAVEQNYMGYAEGATVAELAEKIGIDPEVLQYTIDEYNDMCERGEDTKFHKARKFLHPITGKGGYICGKFYLGAYGTIGGVRINRYGEVLDNDQMPIEGLYAAGTDANTIYGDSYNFTLPGNSMGFAVNTGRMAGEAAAEFVLNK